MKNWKFILISMVITLSICGAYLYSVWRQRQDPGAIARLNARQVLSQDELAVVRAFFPVHFEDTLRLEGTTVWMQNGYVMPYYSYSSGRVQFSQRIGLIPAAQRLEIKKIIKQAIPAAEDDGISHGSRQAFAVFALPGAPALYATPIGAIDGNQEGYFCDMLFYYDDPHTIYDHWPKAVWAAVDAHQVKLGMSELETRMSIGRKTRTDSNEIGNRTVAYDQGGNHWTVTYVKNQATEIKRE
ncbi:MAG: hypothetical protein WAN35_03415 [Terracidiphilus sp.]